MPLPKEELEALQRMRELQKANEEETQEAAKEEEEVEALQRMRDLI